MFYVQSDTYLMALCHLPGIIQFLKCLLLASFRCTDPNNPIFVRPNSKVAWFMVNLTRNYDDSRPINFQKIDISQADESEITPQKPQLCCNVPSIFIEFSNDAKTWTVYEANLKNGTTEINLAEISSLSPPPGMLVIFLVTNFLFLHVLVVCAAVGDWRETLGGYAIVVNFEKRFGYFQTNCCCKIFF